MAASADKLRLFFALWPSDEAREQIGGRAARAIEVAGGRRVPPENYHVTLAFLGNVRATSVRELSEVIATIRFRHFLLELDRTGYWPRSRIAWLGASECPLELDALVDEIWMKLEGLGFVRHDLNPYEPHVSLCREASGGLGMRLEQPVIWPVDAFALVASEPGEASPVYTVLEQFPAGD
jgi:2'-5' RNA ligase